jgi:hypothetical protein
MDMSERVSVSNVNTQHSWPLDVSAVIGSSANATVLDEHAEPGIAYVNQDGSRPTNPASEIVLRNEERPADERDRRLEPHL